MRFRPGNAQHIGARGEQQDAFAFSNPADSAFVAHGGLLAVLADGMGGMSNGRQASQLAVRTFLGEYERKRASEPIPVAMDRALRAAFQHVRELNCEGEQAAGSTLIAAVAHESSLYWLALGDSHIYLLRDSELTQLNREHTRGQQLLDAAIRDSTGRLRALEDPKAAHLTSYLGMSDAPEVDRSLRTFPLRPGDYILLCSDGVYRDLSEKEIAGAFHSGPSQGCENLKSRVLAKRVDQQDNLTILAVGCDDGRGISKQTSITTRFAVLSGLALALIGTEIVSVGGVWEKLSVKPARSVVGEQRPVPADPQDGLVLTFSPLPATYSAKQSVTISCRNRRAEIHYTLDGSEPTEKSSLYTAPVEITKDTVVKAIALIPQSKGKVVTATYKIELPRQKEKRK